MHWLSHSFRCLFVVSSFLASLSYALFRLASLSASGPPRSSDVPAAVPSLLSAAAVLFFFPRSLDYVEGCPGGGTNHGCSHSVFSFRSPSLIQFSVVSCRRGICSAARPVVDDGRHQPGESPPVKHHALSCLHPRRWDFVAASTRWYRLDTTSHSE